MICADHSEIAFVDVGQRNIDILQLGDAKDVGDQFSGETDAAGADDRDFQLRHVNGLACVLESPTRALFV